MVIVEGYCDIKGENDIKNEEFLNKVLHGDCLEWMPQIEDKSIDMILADLPYGTTRNKWDSIIPLDELWREYNRIIKDNGAIVLTAAPPFNAILGESNIKNYRYEWIWDKKLGSGSLNVKKVPLKRHENILVFLQESTDLQPANEKRKIQK